MQSLPRASEAWQRVVGAESEKALRIVRREWRRMGNDFDASIQTVGPAVVETVAASQLNLAEQAAEYIPAVLTETRQPVRALDYRVAPVQWAGLTGDGRTVEGLVEHGVVRAKRGVGAGLPPAQSLATVGTWLLNALGTALADVARGAEQVNAVGRGVGSFARAVSPGACGRCVILAGKRYGSRTAFLRHPACRCTNLPVDSQGRVSYLSDPAGYLSELSDDELVKALGSRANAQAWRDGADLNQLVNAYRGGVQRAQVAGRNIRYTTSGTTRRSYSGMRMRREFGYSNEIKVGRYRRAAPPRLMPSTIYEQARDQGHARELLRAYGWI